VKKLVRVGDILDEDGLDLVMIVEAPAGDGEPWPTLVFPVGFPDETPFRHRIPADFAEKRVLRGHVYAAADAWSAWTEAATS
jgi:hypothetical protein